MAKLTIWGDPHAQEGNLEHIEALFDQAELAGFPVVILGDLLHTKSIVRSPVLNCIMERIRKSSLHFFVLVGNHDYHNLECKAHSLEPLSFLPNVTVVDRPITRALHGGIWKPGESLMLLLPYFHDLEAFRATIIEQVKSAKETGVEIPLLFMHQGVTGFDYGNGLIAENELDFKELSIFKLVISGHFHKYQKKKNLVFLGTPFSHSQGEANQEKFTGVLDLETLKLELKPTNFPQHITLEFDCGEKLPDMEAIFNECRPDVNHVRVILTGAEDAINSFDKRTLPGVKFVERPTQENTEDVIVSEEDSNEVKFSKWAGEVRKLDPETIALGIELLRGVK